jgi:DNA (cytosine-5)-methyltransferase 1
MKILNLFAGIGGNRTLWGDQHEITAVEYDSEIAQIYQERFPGDTMIIGDALEYVRDHLDEYDLIWASPSCVTHSRLNIPTSAQHGCLPPIPDDRTLYGLIRWLKKFHRGMWVVENTMDYLGFLIQPTCKYGRHYFWANFNIPQKIFAPLHDMDHKSWRQLCVFHQIDPETIPYMKWKRNNDKRRTVLRNCVDYHIGKYILDCAIKPKQKTMIEFFQ